MSTQLNQTQPDWYIYGGDKAKSDLARLEKFPPLPWRDFSREERNQGFTYQPTEEQIRMVNASLYLRRPLLITGKPGVGKSSLVYSVAESLGLGTVFRWSITTRTMLTEGLYRYDAIGRMQEAQLNPTVAPKIEKYLALGPLGSALAPVRENRPRVLLIDEIDKSDIDLPNDLLTIFEEGEFDIPELARISDPKTHNIKLFRSDESVAITEGKVRCNMFPFVVLTSNGERDFPAPFLRRCLQLDIEPPKKEELVRIVEAHLAEHFKNDPQWRDKMNALIEEFIERRDTKKQLLANDQLLNAVYLVVNTKFSTKDEMVDALLKSLGQADI